MKKFNIGDRVSVKFLANAKGEIVDVIDETFYMVRLNTPLPMRKMEDGRFVLFFEPTAQIVKATATSEELVKDRNDADKERK